VSATEQERKEAFEARVEIRQQFKRPRMMIEVSGPCRDYDYALFCCDHCTDAEELAAEWTAELIDQLDAGESGSVKIAVRAWQDGDERLCGECNSKKEATDG
jgi:hypothetical protein